jgi:hypothetical protein
MLRPGKPDPLRKAWLSFQEDTLAETGQAIAQAVHESNLERRRRMASKIAKAFPDAKLVW